MIEMEEEREKKITVTLSSLFLEYQSSKSKRQNPSHPKDIPCFILVSEVICDMGFALFW